MIQSFADRTAVDLFRERNTRHARRLPRDLWRVLQRGLKALDVGARLDDLWISAGNRPEPLQGTRSPRRTAFASTFSIAGGFVGERPSLRGRNRRLSGSRDLGWLGRAILPGEMLLEEFLKPLGLRQADAAKRLGISANRLDEVVLGKRRITADTAVRLSRLLKMSRQFSMRRPAAPPNAQESGRAASRGAKSLLASGYRARSGFPSSCPRCASGTSAISSLLTNTTWSAANVPGVSPEPSCDPRQ